MCQTQIRDSWLVLQWLDNQLVSGIWLRLMLWRFPLAARWPYVCAAVAARLRSKRNAFTLLPPLLYAARMAACPLAVWLKGHRPQEIQVRCFYLPNLGDACFLSVFFTESCRERFAWGNAQGQISGHAKSEIRLLAASFACLALQAQVPCWYFFGDTPNWSLNTLAK